jgi:hypothetical protein
MKRHTLIIAALLGTALLTGMTPAGADQQRVFGFTGEVNYYNRGEGSLVVDDLLFQISESTLVHKKRGAKGTLSDISPGTRIGFYPGSGTSRYLSEVWILPKNWQAEPGFAETPEN